MYLHQLLILSMNNLRQCQWPDDITVNINWPTISSFVNNSTETLISRNVNDLILYTLEHKLTRNSSEIFLPAPVSPYPEVVSVMQKKNRE